MFNKTFAAVVLALSASRLVSAQTFTDCNPLEKKCPAEPAFGKDGASCDWSSECGAVEGLPGTTLTYGNNGAIFRIAKESNAPTVATHKRIFFGRLDVELKAAPGVGIVTSVVLESADLDEIDWEWLGGDDTQVQSNYFGKGDTTTYDRGGFHGVHSPTTTFHTYSIEWTSEFINWIIDGATVRTLTYDEAQNGERFPQTPMEVKVGTWVAGRLDAPDGTVEWAGGYAEWENAPFDAVYKSISIVDYAGGNAPTTESIREYVYGDRTGSWESITVVKGDGSSDDNDDDDDEETTTTEAPTTTRKPTTTTEAPEETTTEEEEETTTTEQEETTTTATSTSVRPTTTSAESSSFTTPASTSASSTPASTAEETTAETPAPTDDSDDGSGAAGIAASFGGLAVAGAAILFQLL
jgi:beta-glucanase (GH16 family)